MGFAEGFAAGIAVGKKKWQGGGSGDDEPSYLSDPDYALYMALPRSKRNQAIELVRITEDNTGASLTGSVNTQVSPLTDVHVTADWGDGITTSGTYESVGDNRYKWVTEPHVYEKKGDYIITFTDESIDHGSTTFLASYSYSGTYPNISLRAYTVAIKIGEDFAYQQHLDTVRYITLPSKFAEFYDDRILFNHGIYNSAYLLHVDYVAATKPTKLNYNAFGTLPYMDFTNIIPMLSDVEELGSGSLSRVYNLRGTLTLPKCKKLYNNFEYTGIQKLILPECEEISSSGNYNYSLEEINCPACTSVSNSFILNTI